MMYPEVRAAVAEHVAQPAVGFEQHRLVQADAEVDPVGQGRRLGEQPGHPLGVAAGAAHVGTQAFQDFVAKAPDIVAAQPQIIYVDAPDVSGWGPMGEIQPR